MKKYTFTAEIFAAGQGGTGVLFPYDTQETFGTKGKVPIHATFDGLPYTGSLIKYGFPQHTLHLPKAIREQLGKSPGDSVEVVVWKDECERKLEVPELLMKLMKKGGVLPFFESLSYTHRKEYCRWIIEAKKEETRARRLEKAIEMLRAGVKTPG
jgi:bifunctional DNA-binding transcriptional regulator/antitoxin component of YhaV-PrlF toxin-antitoxin module